MLSYTPQVNFLTEDVSVLAVNFEISKLLERYGAMLSDKQQRILDGYYNCDLSLSEIAENEGMSRQGASDFVKRSEAQLLEFEEKLQFCRKTDELRNICELVVGKKADFSLLTEYIDNL